MGKWKSFLIIVVIALIAVRAVLPSIALKRINSYLAQLSSNYELHIDDLDISIIRGAYRFEGFQGHLKKRAEPFLNAESVDISVAWRDLIRGTLATDISINGLKLVLSQELLNVVSKNKDSSKSEARDLGNKLFPLKVSRLDIKNSEIQIANIKPLPEDVRLRITQIEGRASNLTPSGKSAVSVITLKGALFGSTDMKVVGEINLQQTPNPWVMAFEVRRIELPEANTWLRKLGPLSFKSGTADIYAEVKSVHNDLEGYVKPFFKKLTFVGNKDDFKSFKQFGLEITGATANLLLRRSSDKTLATKVDFSYRGNKFDWNASKAFSEAIEHGYGDKLQPGLENKYKLNQQEKGKKNE